MAERTAWKICSSMGWWSAFSKNKRRGKGGRAGPPVHDDLVRRTFSAKGPNRLWLADITEHRTGEGKLYLCAIKDVFSNRIVGYSISDPMKSRLAVEAPNHTVPPPGEPKPYLCTTKAVSPNRIAGYSISVRMKSRLAVEALNNAVARR